MGLLPLLLLPLMWVGLVLPQRRRQRAQKDLIARLAAGDSVMTTSGIYGTVRTVVGDIVELDIAPNTTIRIARRAIAQTVIPTANNEILEAGA